jgi:ZIP family zinc transporter
LAAAFAWGFLGASTLVVGGAVALRWRIGERALGLIMAFGSGVLISAVSFELVQEAWDREGAHAGVPLGLFAGSGTFWIGDVLVDRLGGADRKHSGGRQAEGSPLAIDLGTVLDGIPESVVLGLTLVVEGAVSAAFLVAVALSNIPEALAATTGLVVVAFVLAFAGGAILTMLADTMMPEAFEHGGRLVGVATTCGFALAFPISALG